MDALHSLHPVAFGLPVLSNPIQQLWQGGGTGQTSVSLNELVRYMKNVVPLATYSGLLTWLGKGKGRSGGEVGEEEGDIQLGNISGKYSELA